MHCVSLETNNRTVTVWHAWCQDVVRFVCLIDRWNWSWRTAWRSWQSKFAVSASFQCAEELLTSSRKHRSSSLASSRLNKLPVWLVGYLVADLSRRAYMRHSVVLVATVCCLGHVKNMIDWLIDWLDWLIVIRKHVLPMYLVDALSAHLAPTLQTLYGRQPSFSGCRRRDLERTAGQRNLHNVTKVFSASSEDIFVPAIFLVALQWT